MFDIQQLSFVDGPGIRTTVFFKGCNLRCQWCHNPESQRPEAELMVYPDKCVGCGRCENIAVYTDFLCYHNAKQLSGKEYTVSAVLQEIEKGIPYFKVSGGGVTFSGGECMLQVDFLVEVLKKCKELNIHTAIDTAGHIPFADFEKVLPYTDLFLYDIKLLDREKHRQFVGADNKLILENLKKLLQGSGKLWIRIPVIAGVNDSEAEMRMLKAFLEANGKPERIELLPYHTMGVHKYAALGRTCGEFLPPAPEKLQFLQKILDMAT